MHSEKNQHVRLYLIGNLYIGKCYTNLPAISVLAMCYIHGRFHIYPAVGALNLVAISKGHRAIKVTCSGFCYGY